jgi:uncharacterized protein
MLAFPKHSLSPSIPMSASSFQTARYLNLGTFRNSGVRVDTPVWFTTGQNVFYVFSNQQAGKVKRLRNHSRCAIAPCTMLGEPTGAWQESEAFLVTDSEEIKSAHRALQKKYGWQMVLLDTGARLGGRIQQRTYIRIRQPE